MAAINDLVAQIKDEALRQQIEAELKRVMKHKKFGLVFEDHLPEGVNEGPIYPGLEVVDWVKGRSDNSPWHALIEADNYYALQLLAYLYPGKVDCIYIDPPYNTGARDWKYNNDYVDSADQYRHSKWLSMMKRRLLLAKRLLNPKDSVLIVTIDEKEYLHLGCLLEELFPEARMQMVSSVINPKGSVKDGMFTRCDEYLFYIFIGQAHIQGFETDFLFPSTKEEVRWPGLKRTGTHSMRSDRPNLFYPLYYSKETGKFVKTGLVLSENEKRNSVDIPENIVAVWPLDSDGNERIWQLSPESLNNLHNKKLVNFGVLKDNTASPYYVSAGILKMIESGEITISGYKNGIAQLEYAVGTKRTAPKTIWNMTSHSASEHGTNLLTKIIGKRFSFPKSLYAVHDAIRFFVANKPNALIVDFFAGSGTTLHAVNLLNAEDGGHRRCIMVTNNEVSAEEAKTLSKQGYKPGDDEWERLGIARYVNWPRTVCSIRGVDVNGVPLRGEYLGVKNTRPLTPSNLEGESPATNSPAPLAGRGSGGGDSLKMADGFDSNCIYFKLRFLDKDNVALGKQFGELLPLLWLRSGAKGMCPGATGTQAARLRQSTANEPSALSANDRNRSPLFTSADEPSSPATQDNAIPSVSYKYPYSEASTMTAGKDACAPVPEMLILPENGFAVLNDMRVFGEFVEQVRAAEAIHDVYLIVDSGAMFREMTKALQAALPADRYLTTCQLYRDYLDNFRINNQR